MANQKYTGMKILRLLLWLLVLSSGDTINYTPATTVSLMYQYPIAVTLGDNPNYTVVSTNGI
jgi:hypothetical protein